jgi:protein-histidine pros-kinase
MPRRAERRNDSSPKARAAAATLQARFGELLESVPDATLIVDRGGSIALVNTHLERMFGYTRPELVGRPVEVLVPESARAIHATHRGQYLADPRNRLMGAELELFGRRKDGTEFPVEISLSPLHTREGPMVTAAVRDITARKGVETKFRGLLEAAPDAMVIVGHDGRIVLVNRQTERLFGYARQELVGQHVEILVPDRFRERHLTHRDRYSTEPRVRPMGAGLELHGRRKDGTEFPVEISLSPMESEDGRLISAAIRDITGQKRLEMEIVQQNAELARKNVELEEQYRRVQEANRLKSEFLANMSHELRTPLNAIIGFTELLHDGKTGSVTGEQQEFLGDILTSSRHLFRLISDMLDYARLEAGKMEFRPEALDLGLLLGDVRDLLASAAASQGVTIETDVAPNLGEVTLDPGKLKQVLHSYLSNALKFTPAGGHVTVRARPEGRDRVLFEVEDTGVGIGAEDIPRLFVEFQQLDGSSAKKYGGAGLGLALARRIVQAQGGRVGVRSAPGQGSTFFATLPRRGLLSPA